MFSHVYCASLKNNYYKPSKNSAMISPFVQKDRSQFDKRNIPTIRLCSTMSWRTYWRIWSL